MSRRRPTDGGDSAENLIEVDFVCTGRGRHPRCHLGFAVLVYASGLTDFAVTTASEVFQAGGDASNYFRYTLVCRRCTPHRNVPLTEGSARRAALAVASAATRPHQLLDVSRL